MPSTMSARIFRSASASVTRRSSVSFSSRSASSAFLRAVTSLAAPNHSVMWPFASKSGTALDSVHPRRAVDSSNAMLQLEHALRGDRPLNGRRDVGPIVRMNVVAEPRPAGTAAYRR